MKILSTFFSKDNITQKIRFETDDRHVTEVVHVKRPEKHIICFSTQIGCPIQCNFCGAARFVRNLTGGEILNTIASSLEFCDITEDEPLLLSSMGVGEPTFNEDFGTWVIPAIQGIDDRLAISTCVPNVDLFRKMAEKITKPELVKIQFSVHTADLATRAHLFGINTPSLNNVHDAIAILHDLNFPMNRVEINVTLIDGENDTLYDAWVLANEFKAFPIKLNRYNEIEGCDFKACPPDDVLQFKDFLVRYGCNVEVYATDGQDIGAACGMLVNTVQ